MKKIRKNKTCRVTIFDILGILLPSVLVIFGFVAISIWFINTVDYSRDGVMIGVITFFSFAVFMSSYLGLFPIYLFWTYYQKEKNVTVFIDYEKMELQYMEKGKETQYIKFEDVCFIENHSGYRIIPCYYKIFLNDGKFVIITSLLMGSKEIYSALPVKDSKIRFNGNLFLPPLLAQV